METAIRAKKIFFMSAQVNLGRLSGGPKVRMFYISEELKKLNKHFFLISGNRRERTLKNLKYIFSSKIFSTRYAYFEPTTSSSTLTDILLMILLRITGTQISLYVRDAFPMYAEYRSEKRIRHQVLNILWFVSQWFYRKLAHILYFQSVEFAELFESPNKKILPPAGVKRKIIAKKADNKTFFYIGGIGLSYNINIMLDAFKHLNETGTQVNLLMFCRENELYLIADYLDEPWLKIQHRTMDELDTPVLGGIIILRSDDLNDRIIPIKVFDYMSLGIPIFGSNASVLAKFIRKNNIGMVSQWDSSEALEQNILYYLSNKENHTTFANNVEKLFEKKHQWKHRAETIMKDFQTL